MKNFFVLLLEKLDSLVKKSVIGSEPSVGHAQVSDKKEDARMAVEQKCEKTRYLDLRFFYISALVSHLSFSHVVIVRNVF